jgi:hypothetical protein
MLDGAVVGAVKVDILQSKGTHGFLAKIWKLCQVFTYG